MADSMNSRKYREVYIPNSGTIRWKEITLNTGASASTLQDIKVAESCGGYTYADSGSQNTGTRNRFIYWKACNDILELVEESLDLDLFASKVRFRFTDTAILGGVSIHETQGCVVVLVPTVASVHRLVFPHPSRLHSHDAGYVPPDQPVPSIFHDASIMKCIDQKNTHMLNPGGSITHHFHTAATYYTREGEGLFVLASQSGSILLVKMPPLGIQGIVQQFELSQTTMMQKLWTGLVPSVMRGGQESQMTACNILIETIKGEPCIFAVCKDHRLKVWSCKNHENILVANLLDYTSEGSKLQSSFPAGSGHTMKKITGYIHGDQKLVVHLNFSQFNQFCILQLHMDSGRLSVSPIASICGPQEDLIDYCLTPDTMVTMWTNSAGTPVIRTLTIGEDGPSCWSDVEMQAAEVADLNIPEYKDPREVYLQRLFQPGKFSKQDIRKALSLQVYSQALDQTIGEAALGVSTLKQDVTIAVDEEIRRSVADYEMQEEDYYQLQLEQWTKFFSCCIQYHEVGGKLKGLFADSETGLIVLVRKGCVTYLRPCDKMEELYFSTVRVDPSPAINTEDNQTRQELWFLFEALQSINLEISEDIANQFEHELSSGPSPDTIAGQLIDNLIMEHQLEDPSPDRVSIVCHLRLINHLPTVISMVLRALDLSPPVDDEQFMDEDGVFEVDHPKNLSFGKGLRALDLSPPVDDEQFMDEDGERNATRQMSLNKLFTSKVGSEILSTCVEQFSQTRFNMLRDIYLLQLFAIRLGEQVGVTGDASLTIRNELLPLTERFLRSYMVIKWAAQTLAVCPEATAYEANVRQLAMLEITDSPCSVLNQTMAAALIQTIEHNGPSLMELFIQGCGGDRARTILAGVDGLDVNSDALWSSGVLEIVKTLAKIVWPLSENFLFPEFLANSCQYVPLQDYVTLTNNWCAYNVASRCFMQGLGYIHSDEPIKAAQCFNMAQDGVLNEHFLRVRFLKTDEMDARQMEVIYYLKVIKQFEEFGAPDIVIQLAEMAIGVADENDPNLATLWSKVFKYELELGHNSEAYNAMIRNPDPSRRKDCLRQLLINLCERGDLNSLVNFPYTDLEEEVESILESRARCMDLSTHNYYDLLYAFHIFRTNYRKAGSVMYEQGMRLGREVPGKHGLQRQAQCYLSALNALRLVKPEYSWIIKPMPATPPNLGGGDAYMRSPKHDLRGQEYSQHASKFEILELHDIEKELMLVDARLRLLMKDNDPTLAAGLTPGPKEMISLLANAGMYDRAVILGHAFDVPFTAIFESLSLRCINLAKNSSYHMKGDNEYTSKAWDWLKCNNLTLTNIAKENSAVDQAWQLLQQYLDKYDDRSGQYHRCTANTLLVHGFMLPTWLVNSYKGLNSAELLRLYIDYDLLQEAVSLCVEYIDAVINTFKGLDSPVFQLKGCLQHEPQTVWLPYTNIDLLFQALEDHKQDIQLGSLYQSLQDKLTLYLGKLKPISHQVGQAAPQQMFIT